jgi:hypothetical protein
MLREVMVQVCLKVDAQRKLLLWVGNEQVNKETERKTCRRFMFYRFLWAIGNLHTK